MNIKKYIKYAIDALSYKTDKKQLLILSDDWGSLRNKSKHDQELLVKKGLKIDTRFNKYDSLETNDDLELLFDVLIKYKDYNGNHPVITAVANMGNPDFMKIEESKYDKYYYETIDLTYNRYHNSDKVLALIKTGIDNKIFIPQLHGREHIQVNWWMSELQIKDSYARKFFQHEFFFLYSNLLNHKYRNRDLAGAFDVMTQEDIESHKLIIKDSSVIFKKLFGYTSKIFTPPAFYYNPEIEIAIFESGSKLLDVGRVVNIPMVGGGERLQINYLGRKKKSGLRVLLRNGIFEPNLTNTDDHVGNALMDIEEAFKSKQPAILSNHRAAFASRIDPRNRDIGLKALDKLIAKVLAKWPDVEFTTPDQVLN